MHSTLAAAHGILVGPDDPRWAAFLRTVPHAFHHTPEYARLAAAHEGGEPAAVLADACVLAPVLIRNIGGGRRDARAPYGLASPLTHAGADIEPLRHALRDEGIVSYFSRIHPLLPAPDLRDDEIGTHGCNVLIDLTSDIESQLRGSHRRDIRRLLRAGFTVLEGADGLADFVEVYRATMRRVRAGSFFRIGTDYFQGLLRVLGDAISVRRVIAPDGAVAAAGLFAAQQTCAEYLFGGTADEFLEDAPSKLLIRDGAEWARSRGARAMNLGGGFGGRTNGLLRFKLGFSRTCVPSRSIRMVVDPIAYRELSDGIDPRGLFPAYRAPELRRAGFG